MITNASSFTGAVLTGGSSTRMGADKALLALDGRPFASAWPTPSAAPARRRCWPSAATCPGLIEAGLDARGDDHPGEGPLGGILTALRLATCDVVVVLACDMPAVDSTVVAALSGARRCARGRRRRRHRRWSGAGAHGRLPRLDRDALHRSGCATGERAVRRAIAHLEVVEVSGPRADRSG